MEHSKETVVCFISGILNEIVKTHHRTIHFWSDGAASQFKSRFMFAFVALHHFLTELGIRCTWSFFETSHGKGPVDGIGGEVKRRVSLAILQRKTVVTNAKTYADVAARETKSIVIIHDIPGHLATPPILLKAWDHVVLRVVGTLALHYVEPTANVYFIKAAKNSPFSGTSTEMTEHRVLNDSFSFEGWLF